MEAMHCPRCREPVLNEVQVGTIAVDVCPECRGTWFDTGELAATLRAGELPAELRGPTEPGPEEPRSAVLRQPRAHPAPESDLPCPRCGRVLDRYWYAAEPGRTFLVDGCRQGHGVWLDAGELELARNLLPRFAAEAEAFSRSGKLDETLGRLERQGLADRLRLEVTNIIRAWLGR
ncbi:MAG TPA: hypothetical protein ENN51_06610 [candidate division WOR-3 bacterium]|uniref:Transcription factor zinc-finger domain-containing protein n=1 Tax=candidate division WOR-3 bacterium TaxID=2052148 RepID=A0A7V0XFB3_UNCW3|nr:hypothetical protein [candidate division WOR-3 bacterium]